MTLILLFSQCVCCIGLMLLHASYFGSKINHLRRQRDVLADHIPDFMRNHDHDDLLLVLEQINEER